MLRKLETNSHANEFIRNWYQTVWVPWTAQSRDLHPVHPAQYQQAVPERLEEFPPHLQEFILRERRQG